MAYFLTKILSDDSNQFSRSIKKRIEDKTVILGEHSRAVGRLPHTVVVYFSVIWMFENVGHKQDLSSADTQSCQTTFAHKLESFEFFVGELTVEK